MYKYNYYIQTVISCFFLWTSLYLLTRDFQTKRFSSKWWQKPSTTAAISFGLISFFCFGATVHLNILSIEDYLFWGRLTWWTSPTSITILFITFYNITSGEHPASNKVRLLKKTIFIIALIYAIIVAVLGTFTNLIFNYQQIDYLTTNNGTAHLYVPPGRFSFLHSFHAPILSLICLSLSLYRMMLTDRKSPKYRIYKTTFQGAFFLVTGSLVSAFGYFGGGWYYTELVSTSFFLTGLIIFVRGVFLYDLLMKNQVMRIDMVQSLRGIINISFIYGIGLTWIRFTSWADTFNHPVIFTGLLYLTTLLHTPIRMSQTIIDSVLPSSLLPAWEKHYLNQISQIKQNIITAADSNTALSIANTTIKDVTRDAQAGELSEMIENEINHIFKHKAIEDDESLAHSRLFELKTLVKNIKRFKEENDITRESLSNSQLAEVLRGFLKEEILNGFADNQASPAQKPTQMWIEFTILHHRYILRKPQNEVQEYLEQLGVIAVGGAYARHLQNGRKRLSAQILQNELLARQEYIRSG